MKFYTSIVAIALVHEGRLGRGKTKLLREDIKREEVLALLSRFESKFPHLPYFRNEKDAVTFAKKNLETEMMKPTSLLQHRPSDFAAKLPVEGERGFFEPKPPQKSNDAQLNSVYKHVIMHEKPIIISYQVDLDISEEILNFYKDRLKLDTSKYQDEDEGYVLEGYTLNKELRLELLHMPEYLGQEVTIRQEVILEEAKTETHIFRTEEFANKNNLPLEEDRIVHPRGPDASNSKCSIS